MTDAPVSRKRYLREKAAREAAEALLEEKSIELYRANRALRELNATLEQKVEARTRELLEATAAREEFLACMSHELRTPLNAIIGFSECINQEMFGQIGNDHYKEYIGLIHQSGQHLLSLINDLLSFSKINSGEYEIIREEIDVEKTIQTAIQMLQQTAGARNITLDYRLQGSCACLMADGRSLYQMLLNLLSNAVKYTNPGGEVLVHFRKGTREALLAVADSGIGIDPQDMDKVLQPFGQAQSAYAISSKSQLGSTGLGLPIVKSLVELHGGRLCLRSVVGKGSLVVLHFPLGPPASPEKEEQTQPKQVSPEQETLPGASTLRDQSAPSRQ
ncbi:HAMP domain-containing sensor histidine kinase [Kiloniella laminariae]|uniref:histidine kinase n=1 Tax=Kiloniella laminariae TaxID=454162 RepID=A0ABT4LFG2_9PROT|nr:HAMP domain-containing sensor histidine kinase [Kiloniella laminariae]MCZ4279838.1 HAMP domain-containing sensor histidine kinase [Kiloniella laminariae]